jgi:hypothetical protein
MRSFWRGVVAKGASHPQKINCRKLLNANFKAQMLAGFEVVYCHKYRACSRVSKSCIAANRQYVSSFAFANEIDEALVFAFFYLSGVARKRAREGEKGERARGVPVRLWTMLSG